MKRIDYKNEIQKLIFTIKSNNSFTDVIELEIFYKKIRQIPWEHFSNNELKVEAQADLDLIWELRTLLHKQLCKMDMEASLLVRKIFHELRDMEDYLCEFAYDIEAIHPAQIQFQNQPIPILENHFYAPYFVADHLKNKSFKFSSGDIIISRGTSFISAFSSKFSDHHSQLSHTVLVCINSETNTAKTVEAYGGYGVATYDLEYALKNENVRLLVLRPKDKELGARAADTMMQKVAYGDGNGNNIPYDYTLNFTNHNQMLCPEVSRAAYEWASNGEVLLPSYPGHLAIDNLKFIESFDLKKSPFFTSADLEIDPNFDLILDWRDHRIIRDSRYKDAILSEIMRWIGELKYNYYQNVETFIASNFILKSRSTIFWPLVKWLTGSPCIDAHTPKTVVQFRCVLIGVSKNLFEKISSLDNEYIKKHNRPMTNLQLRNAIEEIRKIDLKTYQSGKKSLIHNRLRP